jgi:hypothetical protein
MTTTVISTVKNETSVLTYDGGNLLITGTGGVIDTSGDALSFVSTASQPLGTVTIQAGALVFGNGNGIDYTDNVSDGPGGAFLIDGSVEGNAVGLDMTGTGAGAASLTIGATGAVSGGVAGIFVNTGVAYIVNDGTISLTSYGPNYAAITSGSAAGVYLTNTGTIQGANVALNFSSSSGTAQLTNSGQIVGQVLMPSGAVITNSGTIDGAVFSGGSSYLINSGAITQQINLEGGSFITDNGSIFAPVELGTYDALTIGLQGCVSSNSSAVTASWPHFQFRTRGHQFVFRHQHPVIDEYRDHRWRRRLQQQLRHDYEFRHHRWRHRSGTDRSGLQHRNDSQRPYRRRKRPN